MTLFRMQEWITMRAIRKSKKKNRKKRTMEKRKKGVRDGLIHTDPPPPRCRAACWPSVSRLPRPGGSFRWTHKGD